MQKYAEHKFKLELYSEDDISKEDLKIKIGELGVKDRGLAEQAAKIKQELEAIENINSLLEDG